MDKEEFLALLGKGKDDADEKLLNALEKALSDEETAKHSEEEFMQLFLSGQDKDWKKAFAISYAEHAEPDDELLELVLSEAGLSHYGIEGQKWGVRNGPPYPLERRHGKLLSNRAKAQILIDNMDELSLEELEKLVKRIDLEKRVAEIAYPKKEKSFAAKLLEESGKSVLKNVVPYATTYAFKRIVENSLGDDVAQEMFGGKKS